jgi:flagellar hook-associated protein 2
VGDATALRLEMDLAYLLSGSFEGAGSIHSIRELGISLKEDGTLELDESALESRYQEDPEAIRRFFAEEQFGLSAKLDALIERLAGEDNSLLAGRLKTLDSKIEQNEERIAHWDARLDIQRERLLLQFYRMELAIGRLQANLSALDSIQVLAPLTAGGEQ